MSESLVKFPLISFTKDIGGSFCESWDGLFDALYIENSNDYYIDVYLTESRNHKEWVDNYYNIVITKDFYKMYLFKELYDEYVKSPPIPAPVNLDTLLGETGLEVFMKRKNFPLKNNIQLDHKRSAVEIETKPPDVNYYYEAVVI